MTRSLTRASRWSIGAIALLTAVSLTPWGMTRIAALAAEIRTYGVDGRSGRDGRSGEAGTPGQSRSVLVDGQPQQVFAPGGNGQDGQEGEQGERAQCYSQPQNVRFDLQAPSGGDGGDGGNGGDGGDGGDVTLYYTDLGALRSVLVDARGGQPGRRGRGGRGGDGCRCDRRDWVVQVCQNGTCRDERYVCRDGSSGYSGADGRDGKQGNPGQLWLVNQTTPLPPETPTQTLPLESLLRQPVALSKNIWEARPGAGSLVASGSIVADTYQQYVGRTEAQAQVVWQAARPQTDFARLSSTLSLTETGTVELQFPEGYWVAGQSDRAGDLTTFTVTGVVRAEDATRLAWGSRSGYGKNLTAAVIDTARESAYLTTQFFVTYRTAERAAAGDRRPRFNTQFEGEVPANLVTRDGDRFVLALGKLPISDRDLQQGTPTQIELRVVRSLGSNSAEQTLRWEGEL